MEEQITTMQDTGNAQAQESAHQEQKPKSEQRTYTQEEVNALFDARFARESKKWEQRLTESQKMAKMNTEQKMQYEQEKHEKELAEREAAITKRELRAEAKETLAEKGIPTELHDVLNYSNAEVCTAGINALEKAFHAAVDKAVDERIKKSGGTPKTGTTGNCSGVETQFYKLNPQLKR